MIQETTKKIVLIKQIIQAAQDRQKSYADLKRKPMEFEIRDRVMLKVSPWKGVVRFGKRGKLNLRYVGPFKLLAKVGKVAYRLELPQELRRVHHTFHVSNLKKCYTDEPLVMPLEGIHVDDKLQFVELPGEIMDRGIKRLKRSRIPLVKVCWNSRRVLEFTWEYFGGVTDWHLERSCLHLIPQLHIRPFHLRMYQSGTPPVPQDEDEREPIFIQLHDPDYVLGPMYPEYIPLEDEHVLLTEEQPLPPVVSPTAESPEYFAESGPEEDPEDGPVDYPMDGGDDGDDDDDGDSSRDDADDENEDEEDEEDKEEDHLAPTDSAIAAISFPPEANVKRLLAMPTPSPSPLTSLSPPSVRERLARLASTQALIDAVTAAIQSPPLPPPLYIPSPIDRRDDILEIEILPRKRLCLSTQGSRYEIGESYTTRLTGDRGIDYGFVSTLDTEARRRGIGEVGYHIRDTWVDPVDTVPEIAPMTVGEVNTRVTELAVLHERIMAPVTRQGPNVPPNNANPNNMTPESIQAMIDQSFLQNSTNRDESHSSHKDNRRNKGKRTTKGRLMIHSETTMVINNNPSKGKMSPRSTIWGWAKRSRTMEVCPSAPSAIFITMDRVPRSATSATRNNEANPKGNGCFECEAPGHFKRDCLKLKNKDEGSVNAQGWVSSINIVPTPLGNSYDVKLADCKIVKVDTIMRSYTLNFLNHPFNIDLMLVELGSFDVIIDMDWLRRCHAVIVCDEKLVRVPYGNETLIFHGNESNNGRESQMKIISCLKAQEYMAKGCQIFWTQISTKKEEDKSKGKQLKDVPVVWDFLEVFPEDLPGLPPARPVEFQIDLIPEAALVARAPYRLAPSKMKELSE
nr:putative reverse transcriptase domain-containing protein [Tanacetum cinerariifolium]